MMRQRQRKKFAAHSEKLSLDQFNQPLEELAITVGKMPGPEKPPRKRSRGHLPSNLAGIERVIERKSTLSLSVSAGISPSRSFQSFSPSHMEKHRTRLPFTPTLHLMELASLISCHVPVAFRARSVRFALSKS
jgi:hypothetical protein